MIERDGSYKQCTTSIYQSTFVNCEIAIKRISSKCSKYFSKDIREGVFLKDTVKAICMI